METSENALPSNSQAAFAAYVMELERDYLPWYDKASKCWQWVVMIGQCIALFAGVLASILAAAASAEAIAQFGVLRTALVILPALGAFAATVLVQMRARHFLAIREKGRMRMQDIISRARASYAMAGTDPNALAMALAAVVAEVNLLEGEQASEAIQLIPDHHEIQKRDGPKQPQ